MAKIKMRGLYWALIITFSALYFAVAFVSTLHAITFFKLANSIGLAILLGAAYEIGQASVLFSILMTQNRKRLLPWAMMFLLTALQITANVYASFTFMDKSGTTDWTYWQRAILFAVSAESAEMYKIIISWISGALLPLVALGMTALVAENIQLSREEQEKSENDDETKRIEDIIENEIQKRLYERGEPKEEEPKEEIKTEVEEVKDIDLNEEGAYVKRALKDPKFVDKIKKAADNVKRATEALKDPKFVDKIKEATDNVGQQMDLNFEEDVKNESLPLDVEIDDKRKITPSNKVRGWNMMKEFVDDENNVFRRGKFIENDPTKTPTSKKA